MIEPVRSPDLSVTLGLPGCMATGHDRCRGYPVAKGDIDIPLGLRDADVMMSALRRLCVTGHVL